MDEERERVKVLEIADSNIVHQAEPYLYACYINTKPVLKTSSQRFGIMFFMNDRLEHNSKERFKILESKVLSGQEVAEIVLELQTIFGHSVGLRLLEPNAVLAIAGLKGNADIHGVVLDEEANQALIKANEQSENKYGISLKIPGRQDLVKGRKEYQLSLDSLRGYEIKTYTTDIPGIEPFDAKGGFKDFWRMYRQTYEGMETAQGEGKIPPDVDLEVVWEGFLLGYPDQAIWDFEQAYRRGDMDRMTDTDFLSVVPVGFNKGAHPTFFYYPEHKDDPEIQAYIQKARQVLERFYSVPEIRNLIGL